ncbi:hypothetical protein L345_15760, partial [Ophiophagus hannah]
MSLSPLPRSVKSEDRQTFKPDNLRAFGARLKIRGVAMNFAAQLFYSTGLKNGLSREDSEEEKEYDPFWQRLDYVAPVM